MIVKYANNSKLKKDKKKISLSMAKSFLKKATAVSCISGVLLVTNFPLFNAFEAHVINVTARIVNDMTCINPPGGEFCSDGRLEVELSVTLEDAEIYYTINGIDPICGENSANFKYNENEPFELPDGITTVKATACHEELRNGQFVVLQSAIMTEEFNSSAPSVTVFEPENGDIWYCNLANPITYPIEWIVENYRDANELSADIVYITDNDGNGVISAGDNRFSIANNLTGSDGSYPFVLSEDYCYYGYGWAEVTVTESSANPDIDNCKGIGISGRIFDPMVYNPIPVPDPVPDVISIAPEPELAIPDDNDVPDDTEDGSDDDLNSDDDSENNNSGEDGNIDEEIKDEDSENSEDENAETEDDDDTTDETGEDLDESQLEEDVSEEDEVVIDGEKDSNEEDDSEDNLGDDVKNEGAEDVDDSGGEDNKDETNLDDDIKNEGEEDVVDDEEESLDDTEDEDDMISPDETISDEITDDSSDTENIDDDIEPDDDSTELGFSLT